jgi:hypothetical protein
MSFYAIVEAHCDRGKEYRHSALSRGTLATPEGGELDCSLADGHLPLAAMGFGQWMEAYRNACSMPDLALRQRILRPSYNFLP